MRRRIALDRRGISTIVIASVFFITLTLSMLILLLSGFFGFNLAVTEEMKIEQERAQEKISLTELGLNQNATHIIFVRVNNTGTIGVKIRAIYETNRTMTAFLGDPSTYMSTYIEPNRQLRINPHPNATFLTRFQPSAKLTLVTERGTKTTDYEGIVIYGPPKPPPAYDTTRFYIGPLELMFTSFYYRRIDSQTGAFDPSDPEWHPGWNISRSYGYVAWNITIRNIDNRSITINKYSSFTVVPNESPPGDDRTWYLEPVNQTDNTQFLATGEINHIVYKWVFPKEPGVKAQNIYSNPTRCLVFLTFYGLFNEPDGRTTTYAQTIPFEAAITVI